MEVGTHSRGLLGELSGDLIIAPLPSAGVGVPPGGEVMLTGDGIIVTDGNNKAVYLITVGGTVIGRRRGTACAGKKDDDTVCAYALGPGDAYCPRCGTKAGK